MKTKNQTYKKRLDKALALVEGDKPVRQQKSPVRHHISEERSSDDKHLRNQVQETIHKAFDPAQMRDESDC